MRQSKSEAKDELSQFITWSRIKYIQDGESYFERLKSALDNLYPIEQFVEYTIHYCDSLDSFKMRAKSEQIFLDDLSVWASERLTVGRPILVHLLDGTFLRTLSGIETKSGSRFISSTKVSAFGVNVCVSPIFVAAD
jgi:hypothetical protein